MSYERARQQSIYEAEWASVDRVSPSLAKREDVEDFVVEVCERNGLPVPNVVFRHGNAKQSFARCSQGEIHLANLKVSTILHEIAHVVVGANHGHDGVWLSRYQGLIRAEMGVTAWADFKYELEQRKVAA